MIKERVMEILSDFPAGVELLAAAKGRTESEIQEAIDAGVNLIGENYIQEAEKIIRGIGKGIKLHFIGHLQKNKVKKAVKMFDMIETVDTYELAEEIDRRCKEIGKTMEILIEINSGREGQKAGVFPGKAEELIRQIARFENVKIAGLMTMGPFSSNPEDSRPYYIETRKIYEKIKRLNFPNIEMKTLSMGMSNSYQVAIEEGANLVRLGTKIFGERLG